MIVSARVFAEEMDKFCKKCFGHTNWRVHTNTKKVNFTTVVFLESEDKTNEKT